MLHVLSTANASRYQRAFKVQVTSSVKLQLVGHSQSCKNVIFFKCRKCGKCPQKPFARLQVVGHSQGMSALYVMLSNNPSMADKISLVGLQSSNVCFLDKILFKTTQGSK